MKKLNDFVKELVTDPKKMLVYVVLFALLGWVLLQIVSIFMPSVQEIEYKKLGKELERINERYGIE